MPVFKIENPFTGQVEQYELANEPTAADMARIFELMRNRYESGQSAQPKPKSVGSGFGTALGTMMRGIQTGQTLGAPPPDEDTWNDIGQRFVGILEKNRLAEIEKARKNEIERISRRAVPIGPVRPVMPPSASQYKQSETLGGRQQLMLAELQGQIKRLGKAKTELAKAVKARDGIGRSKWQDEIAKVSERIRVLQDKLAEIPDLRPMTTTVGMSDAEIETRSRYIQGDLLPEQYELGRAETKMRKLRERGKIEFLKGTSVLDWQTHLTMGAGKLAARSWTQGYGQAKALELEKRSELIGGVADFRNTIHVMPRTILAITDSLGKLGTQLVAQAVPGDPNIPGGPVGIGLGVIESVPSAVSGLLSSDSTLEEKVDAGVLLVFAGLLGKTAAKNPRALSFRQDILDLAALGKAGGKAVKSKFSSWLSRQGVQDASEQVAALENALRIATEEDISAVELTPRQRAIKNWTDRVNDLKDYLAKRFTREYIATEEGRLELISIPAEIAPYLPEGIYEARALELLKIDRTDIGTDPALVQRWDNVTSVLRRMADKEEITDAELLDAIQFQQDHIGGRLDLQGQMADVFGIDYISLEMLTAEARRRGLEIPKTLDETVTGPVTDQVATAEPAPRGDALSQLQTAARDIGLTDQQVAALSVVANPIFELGARAGVPLQELTVRAALIADPSGKLAQEVARPFYSNLLRIAIKKLPARERAEVVAKSLIANGGSKEEMFWTGLEGFLKEREGQFVTKQEIIDYLSDGANWPVEDVILGERYPADLNSIREILRDSKYYDDIRELELGSEDVVSINVTDLTGPESKALFRYLGADSDEDLKFWYSVTTGISSIKIYKDGAISVEPVYGSYFPGTSNYREFLLRVRNLKDSKNPSNIPPGHFYGATFVDATVDIYTDAQGKKHLRVIELQSDWHQKARERGYRPPDYAQQRAELERQRPSFDDADEAFGIMLHARVKTYNLLDALSLRERLTPLPEAGMDMALNRVYRVFNDATSIGRAAIRSVLEGDSILRSQMPGEIGQATIRVLNDALESAQYSPEIKQAIREVLDGITAHNKVLRPYLETTLRMRELDSLASMAPFPESYWRPIIKRLLKYAADNDIEYFEIDRGVVPADRWSHTGKERATMIRYYDEVYPTATDKILKHLDPQSEVVRAQQESKAKPPHWQEVVVRMKELKNSRRYKEVFGNPELFDNRHTAESLSEIYDLLSEVVFSNDVDNAITAALRIVDDTTFKAMDLADTSRAWDLETILEVYGEDNPRISEATWDSLTRDDAEQDAAIITQRWAEIFIEEYLRPFRDDIPDVAQAFHNMIKTHDDPAAPSAVMYADFMHAFAKRVRTEDRATVVWSTGDQGLSISRPGELGRYRGDEDFLEQEFIHPWIANVLFDKNYMLRDLSESLSIAKEFPLIGDANMSEAVMWAYNYAAKRIGEDVGAIIKTGETVTRWQLSPTQSAKIREEGFPLFQGRGANVKGLYDPQTRVIELVQGKADLSTVLHEVGHYFHQVLLAMPQYRDVIMKYYGDVKTNKAGAEKFARHFEAYLRTGKSPTKSLGNVFRAIAEWMRNIYVTWRHGKAPDEVTAIFDKVYGDMSPVSRALLIDFKRITKEISDAGVKEKTKSSVEGMLGGKAAKAEQQVGLPQAGAGARGARPEAEATVESQKAKAKSSIIDRIKQRRLELENELGIGKDADPFSGEIPLGSGVDPTKHIEYIAVRIIEMAYEAGKTVAEVVGEMRAKYKWTAAQARRIEEEAQRISESPEAPLAGRVTGIAGRIEKQEAMEGTISEPEPTQGHSKEYWASYGKEQVDAGVDYKRIAEQIAAGTQAFQPGVFAILKAGKAALIRERDAIRKRLAEAQKRGEDVESIREEYLAKEQELEQYLLNIRAGKGVWSEMGREMQEGVSIDLGDYAEVETQFFAMHGRMPTGKEAEFLRRQVVALRGLVRKLVPDWDETQESLADALERGMTRPNEAAVAEGARRLIEDAQPGQKGRTAAQVAQERAETGQRIKGIVKKALKPPGEEFGAGLAQPLTAFQRLLEATPELARELRLYLRLLVEERQLRRLEDLIEAGKEELSALIRDAAPHVGELTDSDIRTVLVGYYEQTSKSRSELAKTIAEMKTKAHLLESIERLSQNLEAPQRSTTRSKPSAEIEALRKQLRTLLAQKGLGPYRARLEAKLRELEEHYRQGTRPPKQTRRESPFPELTKAIKDLRRTMDLQDTVKDLEDQLASGNLRGPERRVSTANAEQQALIDRIKALRGEINKRLTPTSSLEKIAKGAGTFKSLQALGDLSALLRQLVSLSKSHPIMASKNIVKGFRALFSEKYATDHWQRIQSDDYYADAVKDGLHIVSPNEERLSMRQEDFVSNFSEKIPVYGQVVKGSNRGMTIMLNEMRFNLYKAMRHNHPELNAAQRASFADMLNKFSGRGNLGKGAKASDVVQVLNTTLFSPQFAISRIQAPLKIITAKSKAERMAAIRYVVTDAVATNLILQMGDSMGWWEYETNPWDEDFGKLRIGDTRLDLWGGYLQPFRVATRIAYVGAERVSGRQSLSPRNYDMMEDLLQTMIEYKASPPINTAYELLTGETKMGEKTSVYGTLLRSVTPLIADDVYDAITREGPERASLVFLLTFFGAGASTYKK